MNTPAVAVLSGALTIRLTPKQLQSLLAQWQREGAPGDRLTLQLMSAKPAD
jgi:hypothetical protein